MEIILAAALLPAIILFIFVFKQDKIEKEPFGLLLSLIAFGALACLPASVLESIGLGILGSFMRENSTQYIFIETFFIVAVAEEGCKMFFLKKRTWRNPEFNYTFDGLLYSVCVGLGFAGLENVMYLSNLGLSVAVARGLLSVPGHCTFAIFMGIFYSHSKLYERYGYMEKAKLSMFCAFLIPVLMHGFFDYCLMTSNDGLTYLFLIFVIIVDISAFIAVKSLSKNDSPL